MTTRKIDTKAIVQASSTYVGKDGELFYDTVTNVLKISDGSTPGGVTLTTDGNSGGGYVLPTASNSTLGGVKVDGTTVTINGSGVISAVTVVPTIVIRAQRTDGGLATDGTKWTFTTISGSGSATFSNNFAGNPTILVTLTGFTRIPSVAYQFDNNLESSGGNQDSVYVVPSEINLLEQTTSGTGFVSPGSPNIITTFTPNTHKFAIPGPYTTAQDFYFEFRQ